jgi:perosamine synthetase
MKKLPTRVKRKKDIWRRYADNLTGISEIQLFNHDLARTSPWFIDLLVENREGLISYMKEAGIGTRVMYPPINKQIAYQVAGEHKVSNLIGEKGLWLPSAVQLTDQQIDGICEQIHNFYRQ